jgi:hypothetical protein
MLSIHRRRAIVWGIVAAAACAVVGNPVAAWRVDQGQGVVPPPPPPPSSRPVLGPAAVLTPGTGFIFGRVVEAGSTTGVSDAIVTISGAALGPNGSSFANGVPAGPRRVVSDPGGRFLFRDLPKGTFTIGVTAPGYVNGSYGTTRLVQVARTLDIALARGVEVGEGERVGGITVQMWKLGGISGTVVDEAGDPMVGAGVSVMARVTDWGGVIMQQTTLVRTDDRGMYHADVTPGDYVVAVLAAPTTMPASAIDALQRAQADSALAREYFVGAMQLDLPIPGAGGVRFGDGYVRTANTTNNIIPPQTNPGGALVMYPTTYYPSSATAVGATVVSVMPGEEKPAINLQLRPAATRRVAGRLIGASGPAANVSVRLVVPDPSVLRTSPATLIDTGQTMTDASGDFVFLGVVPGPYTLRAVMNTPSASGRGAAPTVVNGVSGEVYFFNNRASGPLRWAAEPIVVGDTDMTDLVVRMKNGATVAGRVTFDGTTPRPPAAAFQAMRVVPRPAPGSAASLLQNGQTSGPVDQTGAFITPEIVPGPYTLGLTGVPSGWILKAILASGRDGVDVPVDIGEAGMSDVVVVLSDRISKVTGAVRQPNGQPAATAAVLVFPVDKTLWRQAASHRGEYRRCRRRRPAPTRSPGCRRATTG